MSITLNVGMADYKVTNTPNFLMTAGLGSCVGVCIFDTSAKLGGLAHVMLPNGKENPRGDGKKYADILVPLMYDELLKSGAVRSRLKAKIAGGAQMFSFAGTSPILKIGEKNIQAVKDELLRLGIPLLAYDVGGTFGRTINFDVGNGDLKVRTINHGEKVI